jgi:hypothetical protein
MLNDFFGRSGKKPNEVDSQDVFASASRFLDHSSPAVTTTYLRRLEGQEDKSWAKVAAAIRLQPGSGA